VRRFGRFETVALHRSGKYFQDPLAGRQTRTYVEGPAAPDAPCGCQRWGGTQRAAMELNARQCGCPERLL